jgi:hypothetical protein
MIEDMEYRGATIVIPANDDGAWRWAAHYKKGARTCGISEEAPRPVFESRDAAIAAAKRAIDEFLQRPAAGASLKDDADI